MKSHDSAVQLSVILPIYNEEELIELLHERLITTLTQLELSYEIIYVDDGSHDNSFETLSELYQNDKDHIQIIKLSRNFGQHEALLTGMEFARGKFIVLMNADLQELPEDIPLLYQEALTGYDCVYGIRKNRPENIVKRFLSTLFWWGLRKRSGLPIESNQAMLRLFNRRFSNAILSLKDHSPFIMGMCACVGLKQKSIPVAREKRPKGKSKYTIRKLLHVMLSAFTSFFTVSHNRTRSMVERHLSNS